MNHIKIGTFIIVLLVIFGLFTGVVSARYTTTEGENAGISESDSIYLGESNLNFSAFSWVENSTLYKVDTLERLDGGYMISLQNMIGSISTSAITGVYVPYNSTSGKYGNARCLVSTLNPGVIAVKPFNATTTETHPSLIPKALDVIFYIKDGDVGTLKNQLVAGSLWNEFTLKNINTGVTTTTIINSAGNIVSLIGVADPTDKTNSNYAFKHIDQTSLLPSTGSTGMEITFTINLNGLTTTLTYSYTTTPNNFSLSCSNDKIVRGSTGNVTLTGIPYTLYTLSLPKIGSNTPFFSSPAGNQIIIVNDHQVQVIPDWNGTVTVKISVPENATTGNYAISATGNEGTTNTSFQVTASTINLIFTPPSDSVKAGKFATGDSIKLEGKVRGAEKAVPIYLYITGPGLPANGGNLINGTTAVDGDVATFTTTTYSIAMDKWEYYWLTSGFEPGTYTIHANL
ncbi:MAG: hypothetical protein PHR89_04535, partial [Bacilli bacterium]|nr:hypothetical protein [Bacilli bacterium]